MATLTIELPESEGRELEALSAAERRSPAEVVADLLRRRLAVERLRLLRQSTVPLAERAGFTTDDDVFRVVS